MIDAESLTGIKHQQVSRWAKALKDRQAYRAKLFGKAYQTAGRHKVASADRGALAMLDAEASTGIKHQKGYLKCVFGYRVRVCSAV
jgi:hypothetical protein